MSGYFLSPTAQKNLASITDYYVDPGGSRLYHRTAPRVEIAMIARGSQDIPLLLRKRGV